MLAAAGFMFSAPHANAENTVAIDGKVKHSVVQVWVTWTGWVQIPGQYTGNGQPQWVKTVAETSCTGFVVDPSGFIATAGHCVDSTAEDTKAILRQQMVADAVEQGTIDASEADGILQSANEEQWLVEGQDRGSPIDRKVEVLQPDVADRVIDRWTTAQVVNYQSANQGDNALLKVTVAKPLTPMTVADEVPASGEALTVVGFPGNVGEVVDKGRLPQPSFTSGTVSGQQVFDNGVPLTEVNVNFMPGMSGGPAVASNGEVVGVVSQGFGTQGNNFITNAPALRTLLQQNGVHLAEPPAPAKSFPWIWVVVAVAAVVLLLPVLVLVLRHPTTGRSVQALQGDGSQQPERGQWSQYATQPIVMQAAEVVAPVGGAAALEPTPDGAASIE
jgi:S1-C subfamily serine protease